MKNIGFEPLIHHPIKHGCGVFLDAPESASLPAAWSDDFTLMLKTHAELFEIAEIERKETYAKYKAWKAARKKNRGIRRVGTGKKKSGDKKEESKEEKEGKRKV